ncbi:MAG TPA: hypothetical protein VL096_00020 [Pirellulaceae bacterium]|nr:hypothetical protein [Pirellulaceae bacterium]
MFAWPVYLLAKHWQLQPFLLRAGEQRSLALFTSPAAAEPWAELYCLTAPGGVYEVSSAAELTSWLTAARELGAQEVWIDAALDCQHVRAGERLSLDAAFAQLARAEAEG